MVMGGLGLGEGGRGTDFVVTLVSDHGPEDTDQVAAEGAQRLTLSYGLASRGPRRSENDRGPPLPVRRPPWERGSEWWVIAGQYDYLG